MGIAFNNHNLKHGLRYHRLYKIYYEMRYRCYSQKSKSYKNYGAKGITICQEWLNENNGFINFYNWAINNGYDDKLTIDRINTNGNYEPSNCRWVNIYIQNNNKTNNYYITYNNETKTIADWSKVTGIKHSTLLKRIEAGWTIDKLFSPVRKYKKGVE